MCACACMYATYVCFYPALRWALPLACDHQGSFYSASALGCKCAPPCQALTWSLGLTPRSSCLWGKLFTNGAISPAFSLLFLVVVIKVSLHSLDSWDLQCRPGWPWAYKNHLDSASTVLRLKACTHHSQQATFYKWELKRRSLHVRFRCTRVSCF